MIAIKPMWQVDNQTEVTERERMCRKSASLRHGSGQGGISTPWIGMLLKSGDCMGRPGEKAFCDTGITRGGKVASLTHYKHYTPIQGACQVEVESLAFDAIGVFQSLHNSAKEQNPRAPRRHQGWRCSVLCSGIFCTGRGGGGVS